MKKFILPYILTSFGFAANAQLHTFERQVQTGFHDLGVLQNPFNSSLYVYLRDQSFIGLGFDVAQIDTGGNIINHVAFNAFPYSLNTLVPTSTGFITGGYSFLSDTSALIAFDYTGNIKWSKKFSHANGVNLTPALVNENNNEIFLIGSPTSITSGNNPFLLVKTDTLGNIITAKEYNWANSSIFGIHPAQFFSMSSDNYVIISHLNTSCATCYPPFIVELDPGLNVISARLMQTSQFDPLFFKFIKKQDDSFYVVGLIEQGNLYYKSFIINLSQNFTATWAYYTTNNTPVEGIDFIDALITPSGGLIIGGSYKESNGTYDRLLVEVDANGNLLWAKKIGEADKSEYASSIVYEPNDAIYLGGGSADTSMMNPFTNGSVLKTDVSGNTFCSSQPLNINLNNFNVIFNSQTITSSNVVINSNNFTVTPAPGFTFVNTCDGVVSINENNKPDQQLVYPNPAKDFIFIDVKENTTIEIYNTLGKIVLNELVFNKYIDVSSLNSGIYFYKIKAGDDIKSGKLIKQ